MKLSTAEDFVELAKLLQESLDNLGIQVNYTDERIGGVCDYFKYATSDTAFHEVIKEDGKLVGFLLASLNTSLLEDAPVAQELGAYIKPAYRNRGHFATLLTAFEDWAVSQGAGEARAMVPESLLAVADKKGYNKTFNVVVKRL